MCVCVRVVEDLNAVLNLPLLSDDLRAALRDESSNLRRQRLTCITDQFRVGQVLFTPLLLSSLELIFSLSTVLVVVETRLLSSSHHSLLHLPPFIRPLRVSSLLPSHPPSSHHTTSHNPPVFRPFFTFHPLDPPVPSAPPSLLPSFTSFIREPLPTAWN